MSIVFLPEVNNIIAMTSRASAVTCIRVLVLQPGENNHTAKTFLHDRLCPGPQHACGMEVKILKMGQHKKT